MSLQGLDPIRAAAPRRARVLLYDANPDALARRRGVLATVVPSAEILATVSTTALRLGAASSPSGTVALIDLVDGSRDLTERPGELLLTQVARFGVTPVAWTAHASPDVLAGARAAGAREVVVVDADPLVESSRLAQALRRLGGAVSEAVRPPASAPASDLAFADPAASLDGGALPNWDAWFRNRYACAWAPWMEMGLTMLASSGQRSTQADRLVELGLGASRKAAADRLRDLAHALAGERDGTPLAVVREARFVLTALAATRPLKLRTESPASLLRAAASLRSAPSIATAAGLPAHEAGWMIRVAAHVELARAQRSVGAPLAGQTDADVEWAIGHTIAQLSGDPAGAPELDPAGLLVTVLGAADAVADAERDALFSPNARAAAALVQALRLPDPASIGLARTSHGVLRWQGHSVDDLLWGPDRYAPRDLVELTRAIDDALVQQIQSAPG